MKTQGLTGRRGCSGALARRLLAGAGATAILTLSATAVFAQTAASGQAATTDPAAAQPGVPPTDLPGGDARNYPGNPTGDNGPVLPGQPKKQLPGQHTNVPSTGEPPSNRINSAGDAAAEQETNTATKVPEVTSTGAVKEVVVTGFRNSLRNAIVAKRNSDEIVESVSAEDIGKLPDNSIAESLARLPGVTAQRLDGRDSVISIRGLSPDFTTTLLNGREQVSTGDNRSVEFDQYPSELISGLMVYKTAEAGLVGAGLAGTVDLHTIRPLDYRHPLISFNVRGEEDELNDNGTRTDDGYRVSATFIDQFLDDKLGISFGVARESSPNLSNRINTYGYAQAGTPAAGSGAPPAGTYILGGDAALAYEGDLDRTGVTATIQYRPNSHFTNTFDVYYSDYTNTQLVHGIETGLAYGSGALQPGYTINNGYITNGAYAPIYTVVRNDDQDRQADLYAYGYNGLYDGGSWRVIGDVSYSGVRRRDEILEEYAGTGRPTIAAGAGGPATGNVVNFNGAPDTIGYNQNSDNNITFSHLLNYADPNLIRLSSPQGWGDNVVPGGQDGYLNRPLVRDQLVAYRAAFIKDLNTFGIKTVELGGNFTHHFKSYDPQEYFLGLDADLADPNHQTTVPVPSSLLQAPLSLNFADLGNVLTYDPRKALADGLYSYIPNPNADVATKGWKVREDVSLIWLKATIDQPIGAGTLTGNAGIQISYADQDSTGTAASGSPITLQSTQTTGAKYVEPLPAINLAYRMPSGSDVIRGAITRELARPRMDDMSGSIDYSYAPSLATSTNITMSPWSGTGGNPKLRPWIADAADLSLEHYFGPDGYVSLAGYYKYLETYIYTQSQLYNFTGVTYSGPAPALFEGFVNTPANGNGGNLYGAELTVTAPLNTLINLGRRFGWAAPGWTDGFGMTGSASYTESSVRASGPGSPAGELPGLSKYVGDGTFYYEKYGFSTRVSVRYRSKYLAEVSGFGDSRTFNQAEPETIVDFQMGYQFQDGPLKNLGLLIQAQNLTNEPFILYNNGDERQVNSFQEYGRRFLFGISYKY